MISQDGNRSFLKKSLTIYKITANILFVLVNDAFTGTYYAEVLELADRLDSGSSVRKDVRVQVPSSAFY